MGALNIPTIASGQLQPYQTSNDADAAVESAMTAELSVDLTSGDHTLTQAEFTRSIYFASTGNSVSRTLTTPATNRLFVVHNGGSSALTLKTGSTTLSISSGDTGIFYTDGTTDGLSAIVASTGPTGAAGGDLTGTYPNPTIGAGNVSLAKMANLAANSVIGNNTGSSATPIAVPIGGANGVASLDGSGKVPTAQLPAAVLGAVDYQGTWNANTNSPSITTGSASSANKGFYYKVATAGTTTVDGINDWAVGDWIISDGVSWGKIDNTEAVSSVAGKTGAVTLAVADISGAAPLLSPTFTGTPAAPTPTGGDNTTNLATTAFVQSALAGGTGPTGSAGGDLTGTYPSPSIAGAAVTLAKMANLAANSIIGNNTGSAATPVALTATQVKALLAIAAGDVSGLAAIASSGSASDLSAGTVAVARIPALRFHVKTFFPGAQTVANQLMLRDHTAIATTIPTSGNKASAVTACTANTTLTIKQGASSVGTILFTAGGTTGAFTVSSPIALAVDDILTIVGPATPDATLADISITLAGSA